MIPEYQPELEVPAGHETGTSNNLWTPTNVTYLQSWLVGTGGTGIRLWKHEFRLSFMGTHENFGVVAEEDVSDAQIEDLAAKVSERSAKKILEREQRRNGRLRPEDLAVRSNWNVRRDLAGAWRTYRSWSKKRRASTTGKTLYKSANL